MIICVLLLLCVCTQGILCDTTWTRATKNDQLDKLEKDAKNHHLSAEEKEELHQGHLNKYHAPHKGRFEHHKRKHDGIPRPYVVNGAQVAEYGELTGNKDLIEEGKKLSEYGIDLQSNYVSLDGNGRR